MKLVTKIAMVAAVALAFSGCDDQAKKDLAKCQEDAGKVSAELTTVKAELDAAKEAATGLQTKLDEVGAELEAKDARIAELEAQINAAAEEAAAPAPAAKKPAAKKPAPAPEPVRVETNKGKVAPPQKKR